MQESNTIQKNKYVSEGRNNYTHGICRENFLEEVVVLTLKGDALDCPVDGKGNGQLMMKVVQRTAVKNVTREDRKTAKNMSHFSENNVCLHRMGQLMSAFANEAFELEVDAVIS